MQIASFLARLIERTGGQLPANAPDAYDDDNGSVHESNINRLTAAGVLTGTGPRTFSPTRPVRRDEMATFVARTYRVRAGADLPAPPENYFTDDAGNPREGDINRVAFAAIAVGKTPTTFDPAGGVTRDAMASFLARLLDKLVEDRLATPPPPPPAVLDYEVQRVARDSEGSSGCYGLERGTQSISGTQHEKALYCYMADFRTTVHTGWAEYDLGRNFARFTVTVGQGDTSADTNDTIRFTVYGDGRNLASQTVPFGTAAPIDVDVRGVLRLRLEVTNTSTDSSSGSAIAVWGSPIVQ